MNQPNQEPIDDSVEAVRRDIERTREELARTTDALADKLNVKNQAAHKVEQVKAKAGDVAHQARQAAPEPVQRVVGTAAAKAGPVVQQVAERAAPHRTRILAGAGAALVLWLLVRRARH